MKKRLIQRLVLPAILLAGGLCASAQTASSPWSLENCIRHAIDNNIDLKQREQEQEARNIEMNTSQNSWLPTLNAGLGQNFDFGRSPSKDGTIIDQTSANSSAYLQLNMPVFDGFRIPNDVAARRFSFMAAT